MSWTPVSAAAWGIMEEEEEELALAERAAKCPHKCFYHTRTLAYGSTSHLPGDGRSESGGRFLPTCELSPRARSAPP